MATLQDFPSWTSHPSGDATAKSRAKPAKKVNPILKKLSHSAKGSLDLDRTWEEQNGLYHFDEVVPTTPGGSYTGLSGGAVAISSNSASRRYHHARSVSGTSHVSIATSTSSNGGMSGPPRVGAAFVHPFQQTPRTATPPINSYATSVASFAGDNRDYSPSTITEDDDGDESDPFSATEVQGRSSLNMHRQATQYNSTQSHQLGHSYSNSQPALGLRRPSLVSQKTSSSFSETNTPSQPTLRINTSRSILSTTVLSSRLAHVSSKADLHADEVADTPTSGTIKSAYTVAAPSSSAAPMSPLRSSFDSGFPRLRAKSDLDTATRAEQVREARRKFDEKERAKEEKYAREDIKRREKADNKRALVAEKKAAAALKEANAIRLRQEAAELEQALPTRSKHRRKVSTTSSGRNSFGLPRPSTSRKSISACTVGDVEKFSSCDYDTVNPQNPPAFSDEAGIPHDFAIPPMTRSHTAKKKTQGKWHMFILWLRTKLLRVGKY